MWSDLSSLLRPEQPPGDRVLTVVLCSLFVPGFSAGAVGGILEPDAFGRVFGVVRAGVALLVLGILVRELYWQSRRPAARWTGSDTANVTVVGGTAVLIGAAIVFASPPAHERITGAVVAVLYAALALAFGAARRRALLAARLFPQLP